MSTMYKHKLGYKYPDITVGDGDITVHGEEEDSAKKYSGLAAMLAQGAGEIASAEAKKKKDAEKNAAINDAKAKYKAAELAKAEAIAEADMNGPLHKKAADAETAARVAQAKVAVFEQLATGVMPSAMPPMPSTAGPVVQKKWYENTAVLVAGGAAVVLLGFMMMRRK